MSSIYYGAVAQFAQRRFEEIARQVVHRLQRIEATGAYGDDYGHQTLWDEYCHEVQDGPTLFEDPMKQTIDPIIDTLLQKLSSDEAVILTLSDPEFDESFCLKDKMWGAKPSINREYLTRATVQALAELAGARDLDKFDPTR